MTTYHSGARSISELDLEVSERQALGASYQKPKNIQELVDTYWSGKLVLPPQPVWQGDPTDWTADPFKDRNWRFQHHTLRWLNPLRWRALEGDGRARAEWLRVARSWAEANVPASVSKSDFAWKDMADGNRAIQLSLGAPLVHEDDEWYLELLQYHRDWLADPAHIVTNNHALHQHCGLFVVSAVLRDQETLSLAVERMISLFDQTFDIQGANDEGSVNYHQLNMVWWSEAWQRVSNENIEIPSHVPSRLTAAGEVLAHMAMPNGDLPQIGDGARSKVRKGLSDASDYIATSGEEGAPPQSNTLVLERGYIFSRSGWGQHRALQDESHMLVRYGKSLKPRVHSHYDRGSIHIYADGQPWLVDSGFHSYQPSAPENQYLISREAHNLATITGLRHAPDSPVVLLKERITENVHDFTLHDQGYKDAFVTRRILYFDEPDFWIVSDEVDQLENKHHIAQNWFIEPKTNIRYLDNGFRLQGSSSSFAMYWLGKGTELSLTRAKEDDFKGWIGTKWRTLVPSSGITARSRPGAKQLVTLLSPRGTTPLSIVESHVATSKHIRVHLARGARSWQISIGDEDVKVKQLTE